MILCIAEKPQMGRDIARLLGCNKKRDGYMEGDKYIVTWTFGHLCELKDPADYTERWRRWSLSALPMIPPRFGIKVKNDKGVQHQFKVIEQLISQCDEIINCGDAGQEGELIQRWVMQKAGNKVPVKRLWINSLTDDAILAGFKNLRPEKDLEPLYIAGLCRAIGDWILGINATRLYTLKYGANNNLLSIGRVQTPTLALIVKRQLEIENFVPTDSWELKTTYRGVTFSSTLKPFSEPQKGETIVEECRNLPIEITNKTKKSGKEIAPRLFDLTSLQVECNKKFGMGAEETLNTIQSLYEKKITTYPRVDTTYLTEDIYPKCKNILNSLTQYSTLLQPLRGSRLKKSKKVFDNSKVTDHHAIIPTGMPLPQTLSEDEKKVFDTIARRFIAAFYPDCTFEQTQVDAKVGKYNFKASGKVIIDSGWKAVYANDKSNNHVASDGDSQDVMPDFQIGESGPHEPKLAKKTTQPPKYYTEGTLLKAMETAGANVEDPDLRDALKANGIGRPSTRANIIKTLYQRGYIKKERKSLRATQAAFDLMGVIKVDILKSVELTGKWEAKLRQIERGAYNAQEFINDLKTLINEITLSVLQDSSNCRIQTVVK